MKEIIAFQKEIEFKSMLYQITSISLEHNLKLKDQVTIGGDFFITGTYKMTSASQLEEEFSYKIPVDIAIDDKYDTSLLEFDIDDFTYEIINEEKLFVKIELSLTNLKMKEQDSPFKEMIFEEEIVEENLKVPKEEEIEMLDEVINGDVFTTEPKDARNEDLFLDTTQPTKVEIKEEPKVMITKNDKEELISEISMPISNEPIKKNVKTEETKNSTSLFTNFEDTSETYATYHVHIMRENDTLESIMNKFGVKKEELEVYNNLQDISLGTKVIIPKSSHNE